MTTLPFITRTPGVYSGQPCLRGTRTPASTVRQRFDHGETAEKIAEDLGLPVELVNGALAEMGRVPHRPYRPLTLVEARRRIKAGLPVYSFLYWLSDEALSNTLVTTGDKYTRVGLLPQSLPSNWALHDTQKHEAEHRARVLAVYESKYPNCTMADLEAA